jgi:hypothetical protein
MGTFLGTILLALSLVGGESDLVDDSVCVAKHFRDVVIVLNLEHVLLK